MSASKYIILGLYLSIFWRDIFAFFGVSTTLTLVMLIVFTLIGYVKVARNSFYGVPINSNYFTILVFAVFLWAFSMGKSVFGSGDLNLSNYYLAIPVAFVIVSLDVRFFFKIIALHLVVSIILSFYEIFNSSYLYDYVAADGTVLDSNLFGGGIGVFRAKGLFQGPLSQVAIAYWVCFIYRSKISAFILLLAASLSAGRLGLLVGVCFFTWRIIFPKNLGKNVESSTNIRVFFLVLLALIASYLTLSSISSEKIMFITMAFDISNTQTTSRFQFWSASLNELLNYDFASFIFGNYGYIQDLQGGTENDFLRIALDNGLMLSILYVSIFTVMIFNSVKKRDLELFIIVMSVFILMNIFPFIQSLSSTLMFWTVFLSLLSKHKGLSTN